MSAPAPLEPEPEFQVLEAAALWFATLRSGTATARERSDWQAWLQAAPAHRIAWARVEAISQGMRLPGEQPLAADAALQAAARLRRRRRTVQALSVLAVAGLGGWGAVHTSLGQAVQAALGAEHRTGVGEVRELVLRDGSRLWLNTASAVDSHDDEARREVRLRRGEILVATQPDPRPFVVVSAQGRMRALGTRFNVRQFDDATGLDVFEGRVEVTPAEGAPPFIVEAGERVRFTASAVPERAPADPARAVWTRRVLLADDRPLGEVVAELARYRHGRLACDPAIAGLRVVGGFPLDSPDQALAMLQASLPIEVHAPLLWWVTVRPR